MSGSTPPSRRVVDRPTLVVVAAALAAFAAAAAAAVVVARLRAAGTGPAQYSSEGTAPRDLFGLANVVALAEGAALLLGVLLVGTALVFGAVRHALPPTTPWVLGTAAVVLGLGAVLAGAVLAGTADFATATRLTLLRTTLGGLAVAALPALVVAVVRTGRARS